jgi:hypothetical protein
VIAPVSPAGRRVRHIAGLISVSAFLETHPGMPQGGVMVSTFPVPRGSFAARKAYADHIADVYGATPVWRNGYYMAVRDSDGMPAEIHFAPLILEADARGGL